MCSGKTPRAVTWQRGGGQVASIGRKEGRGSRRRILVQIGSGWGLCPHQPFREGAGTSDGEAEGGAGRVGGAGAMKGAPEMQEES